jgi:hypothetical protein
MSAGSRRTRRAIPFSPNSADRSPVAGSQMALVTDEIDSVGWFVKAREEDDPSLSRKCQAAFAFRIEPDHQTSDRFSRRWIGQGHAHPSARVTGKWIRLHRHIESLAMALVCRARSNPGGTETQRARQPNRRTNV